MRRLAARSRVRTWIHIAGPLLVILLLAGCLFPPKPETTQARDVYWLYALVFVMGAVVFFGVEGAIVYSIVRYRRRDDRLPDQLHGNTVIEILWTVIPTVIVLFLFVISTITLTTIQASSDPAVTIEVTGFQWQWTFHYLDSDNDPKNDYSVTGTVAKPPVMGLPTGQPIRLILKSSDVIHSFFVPNFLVKRDVVPFPATQKPNELAFTITDPGTYGGQCAEFCGDGHSKMTFTVQAMAPADYQKWLADAKAGKAPPPPSGSAAPGTTVVQLSAQNIAFSTASVEVKAGKPFVVHFDNKDSIAHNVGIFDQSGKEVFTGDIFTGPKAVDYQVPALPAGKYIFHCDVHPVVMTGTLTAK